MQRPESSPIYENSGSGTRSKPVKGMSLVVIEEMAIEMFLHDW